MKDVAIVGAGMFTTVGGNVSQSWQSLLSNKTGLAVASDNVSLVALINNVGDRDRLYKISKISLQECIADANWADLDSERTALIFAHASPDNENIVMAANRFDETARSRPDIIYRSMNSYVAAKLSKEFSIKGPVYSISAACAGSSHVIHLAKALIDSNIVDRCLCGGGEVVSKYTLAGFTGMRAVLSKRIDLGPRAIQPFGAERSGIGLGEGSGWIALEKSGSQNDVGIHITNTTVLNVPEAVYGDVLEQRDWDRLLKNTVNESCELVIAHATSTPKGDLAEGEALLRHFSTAEIRSTKYTFGHTLSASSILDVIVIRESMLAGKVTPIGHDYEIDPILQELTISTDIIKKPIKSAMKISAAFGGAISSIALANRAI